MIFLNIATIKHSKIPCEQLRDFSFFQGMFLGHNENSLVVKRKKRLSLVISNGLDKIGKVEEIS